MLTAADIKVNHIYRGKHHVERFGITNERVVLWVGGDMVQYDSDTVRGGRHYPKVRMEQFLRWAKADVTNEYRPVEATTGAGKPGEGA